MTFPQLLKQNINSFFKQNSAFILVPTISYVEVTAARAAMTAFILLVVGAVIYLILRKQTNTTLDRSSDIDLPKSTQESELMYTMVQTHRTELKTDSVVSHNYKRLYVSTDLQKSSQRKTFFEKLFHPIYFLSSKRKDYSTIVRKRIDEMQPQISKIIFFKKITYRFKSHEIKKSDERTATHHPLFNSVVKNKFDIDVVGIPSDIDTKT